MSSDKTFRFEIPHFLDLVGAGAIPTLWLWYSRHFACPSSTTSLIVKMLLETHRPPFDRSEMLGGLRVGKSGLKRR